MYLIDTNVLSEAWRGSVEARTWLRSVDPTTIYVSVVTLGEIMKGIVPKLRSDPPLAASLMLWLERLRHEHAGRILPIDDHVALRWGRLAAERPRGMADGLIAATAQVHDKIVVTRNAPDFADTGTVVINPWEGLTTAPSGRGSWKPK
jgi:predicted nucleic acid-binding protein